MFWGLLLLTAIITLNVLLLTNVIILTNIYVNWVILVGSFVGIGISFNMMYDVYKKRQESKVEFNQLEDTYRFGKYEYGVGLEDREY